MYNMLHVTRQNMRKFSLW